VSYVKLDSGILDSSLWAEAAEVRLTFITILAMADPEGLCASTAPGIARRANLPLEAVRHALTVLEAPDPESRTLAEDGRRLVRVDGGYRVVNYLAYREKDHTAAERQRRARERKAAPVTRDRRDVTRDDRDATVTNRDSHAASRKQKQKQKQIQSTEEQAPATPSRVTWLTPYCEAWTATTGGEPPGGVFSGVFKKLEARHPREKVLAHWRNYLATVPAQYLDAVKFSQKFGAYAPGSDPTSRPAGNWDTPEVSEQAREYAREEIPPDELARLDEFARDWEQARAEGLTLEQFTARRRGQAEGLPA